jgi:hypothetical protein
MEWKASYKTFGSDKFVRPHEFYFAPGQLCVPSVASLLSPAFISRGYGEATPPFPSLSSHSDAGELCALSALSALSLRLYRELGRALRLSPLFHSNLRLVLRWPLHILDDQALDLTLL